MTLAQNPVYTRLTRHARWPSVRMTFRLGIGLGFAASVWAIVSSLLRLPGSWPWDFHDFGMMVSGISDFTLPALFGISGWAGAIITARDTRTDEYLLQRISPMLARNAVYGYFGAVLFSLRFLLAALAAWIPVMVVTGFDAAIDYRLNLPSILAGRTDAVGVNIPELVQTSLIAGGLGHFLAGVGLLGVVVFGAAFGVWMGLFWRHTTPATVSAILPGVLTPLIMAALLNSGIVHLPVDNPLDGYVLALNASWLLIPAALWLAARAYDRGRPV